MCKYYAILHKKDLGVLRLRGPLRDNCLMEFYATVKKSYGFMHQHKYIIKMIANAHKLQNDTKKVHLGKVQKQIKLKLC